MGNKIETIPGPSAELLKGGPCHLVEKWENLAASWLQVAREINAPDISTRARARAVIYQDCAEDLKANAQADTRHE